MPLSTFDIRNRYWINRYFVEAGHSPTIEDLSARQECAPEEIRRSLRRLHDDHRLLLYPDTNDVWVAHPFSATASNYWVESGARGWWANCGFCSLGIAAMLGRDTTIHSRLGAERTPVRIRTHGKLIEPVRYRLHIPLAIACWHDNLSYTCGNAHFFDSTTAIDHWCVRHRVKRGQALPIGNAWNMALKWYGDYLDPDWQPRTNAETNLLLQGCGLEGSFWRLPDQ